MLISLLVVQRHPRVRHIIHQVVPVPCGHHGLELRGKRRLTTQHANVDRVGLATIPCVRTARLPEETQSIVAVSASEVPSSGGTDLGARLPRGYPSRNKRTRRPHTRRPLRRWSVRVLSVVARVRIPSRRRQRQRGARVAPSAKHKASVSLEQSSQAWCNPELGASPPPPSGGNTYSWEPRVGIIVLRTKPRSSWTLRICILYYVTPFLLSPLTGPVKVFYGQKRSWRPCLQTSPTLCIYSIFYVYTAFYFEIDFQVTKANKYMCTKNSIYT